MLTTYITSALCQARYENLADDGYFRQLGFDGPYSGGKHQFMAKGEATVRLQIRTRAISERIFSPES
jgi:hypothetical protein